MRQNTLHVKKPCELCGTLFFPRTYSHRWCSLLCAKRGQPYYINRIELEKTCAVCGQLYKTARKKQKYCSRECRNKAITAAQYQHSHNHPTGFLKMRFEVFARDKFKCKYCGRGAGDDVKLVVDHIVAKNHNGANELSNLITSCNECNLGKSDILLLANKNGQLPTCISI